MTVPAHETAHVRDDRRAALVSAAYHQIAERGFEGLRTRDVAAEAGVNVATLHYYFPTKEALIRGVLGRATGHFRETLSPSGSAADQLRNHLRGVRQLLIDEPELGVVMAELTVRATRDPGIAAAIRDTNDIWHSTLRGLIHRGVTQGQLDPAVDNDDVVAAVIAALRALTLLPADPARSDRVDGTFRQIERWLGLGTGEETT
jgi:AcrR family transcriptional regulator